MIARTRLSPLVPATVLLIAACSGTGDTTTTTTGATTTAPSTTGTAAPTPSTAPAATPDPGGEAGRHLVTDHGAVADGKTDATPAFQAAIDAAAERGGVVVIPPAGGQLGYVLNSTVRVPSGVAIVGDPAGRSLDVSGPYPWPDTGIAGAKILARPEPAGVPLFELEPGTTVRGLWISYDRQPMPTDDELVDEEGDYLYRSFDEVREQFVDQHVEPAGPTFHIARGDRVTIADVVADRYYDFLYMEGGGPLRVDGVSLYGYRRGFTIEESESANVFRDIDLGPAVGPHVPGEDAEGARRSWVFGAIASNPENVGFHFGRSDGFVLDGISFTGGHTAVRLGAAFEHPLADPLAPDDLYTSEPGQGPWGHIEHLDVEDAAVGLHLVSPSVRTSLLSGIAVDLGIDDGLGFSATGGSGDPGEMTRQAFVVVEPSYSAVNNGIVGEVPSILAGNVSVTGGGDPDRYGEAASPEDQIDGRVFLVDGDLGMEINGFSLGAPFDEARMVATGADAGEVSIRLRGYLLGGRPEADRVVDEEGVTVLSGDVVVVESPPPPPIAPPTTEPPATTEPPETTTTTVTPTTGSSDTTTTTEP